MCTSTVVSVHIGKKTISFEAELVKAQEMKSKITTKPMILKGSRNFSVPLPVLVVKAFETQHRLNFWKIPTNRIDLLGIHLGHKHCRISQRLSFYDENWLARWFDAV